MLEAAFFVLLAVAGSHGYWVEVSGSVRCQSGYEGRLLEVEFVNEFQSWVARADYPGFTFYDGKKMVLRQNGVTKEIRKDGTSRISDNFRIGANVPDADHTLWLNFFTTCNGRLVEEYVRSGHDLGPGSNVLREPVAIPLSEQYETRCRMNPKECQEVDDQNAEWRKCHVDRERCVG